MKHPAGKATGPGAREILRARARALARSPVAAPPAESLLEVLEFRLAREHYAVETRHVREVVPLKQLTSLPCTPPFVLGLVNLRGHVLPVFDIRKFFDLPEQGLTDLHRIVFIHGQDMEVGLLAEAVETVRSIPLESLQPSLPTLTGIRGDYLKGVTAGRLIVLDVDRILTDPRIVVDEAVEG